MLSLILCGCLLLSACANPTSSLPREATREAVVAPQQKGAEAGASVVPAARQPAVAGQFYPANPDELQRLVDSYLARATRVGGRPIALIAPHAGYVYSGQVAAQAFKQLEGQRYDVVVLLGANHTSTFRDISVYAEGSFATPLGDVPVDAALAQRLLTAHQRIVFNPEPHLREHSIEVELPFLQRTLGDFKIVPIIIGAPTMENCRILADALGQALAGRNALVVASSDMSHYPTYQDANRIDGRMLAAIESLDVERVQREDRACLSEKVNNLACTLCGLGPVMTAMMYARNVGANQATTLAYLNSGDVDASTRSRVVGYGAVMFWQWDAVQLDAEEQAELLKLARQAIAAHLQRKPKPSPDVKDPKLLQPSGAFVTLEKKGELRGCIGQIVARDPLYQTVQAAAISAATEDPRFPPCTARELDEITIEISVLSPMRRVQSVEEIQVGTHGLYIRKGQRSGLLLPQVAPEQGWDRAAFLAGLCRKAGLAEDAWRAPDAALYSFTAQVFGE